MWSVMLRASAGVDDGEVVGTTTAEAVRVKQLEQENRELKRANAILRSASAFFAAELCATRRGVDRGAVKGLPR